MWAVRPHCSIDATRAVLAEAPAGTGDTRSAQARNLRAAGSQVAWRLSVSHTETATWHRSAALAVRLFARPEFDYAGAVPRCPRAITYSQRSLSYYHRYRL